MEFAAIRPCRRLPRPWVTTVILGVLLAVVGVLLLLVAPSWHKVDSPVTATRELANLKTLGLALRVHAEEHDGKFPASIAGIEWRQNLPGLQRDGLPAAVSQFHDPGTGREHRWTYYQGHALTDPPETILAAAPFALGKARDRRLVVRLSAVAEIINEADFQKQIAEQQAHTTVPL